MGVWQLVFTDLSVSCSVGLPPSAVPPRLSGVDPSVQLEERCSESCGILESVLTSWSLIITIFVSKEARQSRQTCIMVYGKRMEVLIWALRMSDEWVF